MHFRQRLPRKGNKNLRQSDDRQLCLLSLPAIVWYILFCYLPMFGLLIAFKKYRVAPGKGFLWSFVHNSAWCGLDNFKFLFLNNSDTIVRILVNTVGYNAFFILLDIAIPVSLAIILDRVYSRRLARFSQAALLLPHFLSWVVVGYFVYAFLATDNGLLNRMLTTLGFSTIKWYQKEAAAIWPLFFVFLHIWKATGFGVVIYSAAIKGIDSSIYDAAMIDGATCGQQTRYITLPLLRRVMLVMLILSTGRIFYSDFGLFYRTTRNASSLTPVFQTIDVYVYNALFNTSRPVYGYISAAGFLQSVLGCAMMLAANAVIRKTDYSARLF